MTKTPNPIDVNAGARLRHCRMVRGLSQTDLGKAAVPPVTFQQIQKYEKGMNRIATSRLAQFADILRVGPEYFFSGTADNVTGHGEATFIDVFMGLRSGVALAKAFVAIKDRETQKRVVALVEQIVEAQ